jgi:hypothetical protein
MKEAHEIRGIADRARNSRLESEALRYLGVKRLREYAVELSTFDGTPRAVYQEALCRIREQIEADLREKIRAERQALSTNHPYGGNPR